MIHYALLGVIFIVLLAGGFPSAAQDAGGHTHAAELRYVHLSTHLRTLPILTPRQIHTYNRIRGYFTGEPGSSEDGVHSPQMHRP